ncbi:MAG TPA: YceI family protein [Flavobacterium sp.]|jgi:polyisoprenoid-binding protein YceI
MKKVSLVAMAAAAMFITSCNQKSSETSTTEEQEVAEKQGEVYAVNLETSKVNWKAFHKGGFAPRWGTLNIKSGEVSVDGENLTAGDFVIDMQSLTVDPASVTEKDKKSSDLQDHLKSADFFDVAKNPTAAFTISSVSDLATPPEGAIAGANKTISGNLTLQAKTMNVSFPAKVTVADGTVAIAGNFTVNRTDWGLKFGTDEADPAEWMISKDIEIGISVQAAKK